MRNREKINKATTLTCTAPGRRRPPGGPIGAPSSLWCETQNDPIDSTMRVRNPRLIEKVLRNDLSKIRK